MMDILSIFEKVMEPYPKEIEQKMLKFYESLSEKDRRHYAAIEPAWLAMGIYSAFEVD